MAANIEQLKERIRLAIKANGSGEITGEVLQTTLLDIVDELAQGAYEISTSAEVLSYWNNINT